MRPDSKLLITRGEAAGVSAAESAQRRLEKLRQVADKLAAGSGRGLTDNLELSLEDQASGGGYQQ